MNQFHEKDVNERDAYSRMGVSTANPILEEPYAGKLLVRICGGAGGNEPLYPEKQLFVGSSSVKYRPEYKGGTLCVMLKTNRITQS